MVFRRTWTIKDIDPFDSPAPPPKKKKGGGGEGENEKGGGERK